MGNLSANNLVLVVDNTMSRFPWLVGRVVNCPLIRYRVLSRPSQAKGSRNLAAYVSDEYSVHRKTNSITLTNTLAIQRDNQPQFAYTAQFHFTIICQYICLLLLIGSMNRACIKCLF